MRKLIVILFIGVMSFNLQANDSHTDKVKPVVSNYATVFSKIKYPIVCREKGIEGVVKVKITVDKRGQIRRYRILESPCSDLREAVEQVLPSLEFEPATVEGREVNSKIVIPVDFRLTY